VPRRLLNVGSSIEPGRLFLFEITRLDIGVPYVALSYCWGDDVGDILKTTKSNIQSHYQEIQLSSLPQTIQDARISYLNLMVEILDMVKKNSGGFVNTAFTDVFINSWNVLGSRSTSQPEDLLVILANIRGMNLSRTPLGDLGYQM
jgi:hypothetical protein